MASNRDRKKRKRLLENASNQVQPNPQVPQRQQVEERTSDDSSNIIRHGAGRLETFELRESELEKLENDMWGGRYCDFGITCISVGVTIVVAILSSKEMNEIVLGVFGFLLLFCVIGGTIFFSFAYRRSKERKAFFKCIRER